MKQCVVLILLCWVILVTAAENETVTIPEIELDSLAFGDTLTLDVMTWNIEHFPKHKETISYVAQVINAVTPDILGLQEIESDSAFAALIVELNKGSLEQWGGFRANSDEWDTDLAFIYNSDRIIIRSIREIYFEEEYDSPLPRRPLVLECDYKGHSIVVMNNHLKAMPGEKNEVRREAAMELIDKYIVEHYKDDNFIMLGDLNDYITDDEETNVFKVVLDRTDEYAFADMEIAANPEADWSYPYYKYRGHLDHILLSNELFDNFIDHDNDIKVVVIERFMDGGEQSRYDYITDHRPVIVKLRFD